MRKYPPDPWLRKLFGLVKFTLIGAICAATGWMAPDTHAKAMSQRSTGQQSSRSKPNIVLVLMDNFGFGELGSYGGGILRGAATPRIDGLAAEGYRLLNYNAEPICSPSRASLLTGRYAIRSGVIKTAPHAPGGLVQWERTLAEALSDNGYATAIYGKWHLGNSDGRMPTDQGFDDFFGIPNTTSVNDAPWPGSKPNPLGNGTDGYLSAVLEGRKGEKVHVVRENNLESRRKMDGEVTDRSVAFIKRNAAAKKPFFLYVPYTQTHEPVAPSDAFNGKTGNGYWADTLAQADAYVGRILDTIDDAKIRQNTIVIFASDNGAETRRGWAGPWTGAYNTAMEGGLRVPFIIRWPGKVPANKTSNEIVHGVDMFATLTSMTNTQVPEDRPMDGVDESGFLLGKQENSNRTSFPVYYHSDLYAVKYKNFKVHYMWKVYRNDKPEKLDTPKVIDLYTNPQEFRDQTEMFDLVRNATDPAVQRYFADVAKNEADARRNADEIAAAMQASFDTYPNIPEYAPDPYVPGYSYPGSHP